MGDESVLRGGEGCCLVDMRRKRWIGIQVQRIVEELDVTCTC